MSVYEAYRAWYVRTWPRHVLAAPEPYFVEQPPGKTLLTIDMITREAMRFYRNSMWLRRTIGQEVVERLVREGSR